MKLQSVAEKQRVAVELHDYIIHFRENMGAANIFVLAGPYYDSFL